MMRRMIVMAATSGAAILVWASASVALDDTVTGKWVDINALVSTRYTYSFDRPEDDRINARVVDTKDNTFSIDTASLFVSRMEDDESFGFGVALDFGDAAEAYATQREDPGSRRGSEGFDGSDDFELREAFVTYNLPVAGISVKAGKFATLLGYEVMKTNSNFNHNISHSILFGFSIPFTHTGVLVSAPITEQVGVDIGVVNGWDNVDDNNTGKTLLAGLGVQPSDMLSFYAAGTYGSESDPRDDGGSGAGSKRGTLTVNSAIVVTDQLSFVLDAVYGHESDLLTLPGKTEDAYWYGFGAYALFDLDERWSLALRGEVFDDENIRGSFADPADGRTTIWSITPTVAFRLNDYVMLRAEYRHDESSTRIFAKDNTLSQSGWDTIAGEILVGF